MKPIAASCILTLSLGAFGCSKKNKNSDVDGIKKEASDEKKEMGRYVEEEIKLPKLEPKEAVRYGCITIKDQLQVLTTMSTEDGDIDRKAKHPVKVYTKDGEEWKVVELPNLWKKNKNSYIERVVEFEPGKWYILNREYKKMGNGRETNVYTLYQYEEQGEKLQDITPDMWFDKQEDNEYDAGIELFDTDASGNILYCTWDMDLLYRYNPQTKERTSMSIRECYGNLTLKDDLIYTYNGRDQIEVMDFDKNEVIESIDRKEAYYDGKVVVDQDGEVYFIGNRGIEHYRKDTKMWEKLVDAMGYSFGADDCSISSVLISGDKKKEFSIDLNGKESKIIKISFDETQPKHKDRMVTICSMFDNNNMRTICNDFAQKNPDVEVQYNFLLAEEDMGLMGDTVKTMNSELLAGQGADIYLMEGLSSQKMIEKGVFKDLAPILKEKLDSKELLPNIMEGMKDESGKLCEVPLRVKIPFYFTKEQSELKDPQFEDFYQELMKTDSKESRVDINPYSLTYGVIDCYGSDWIEQDKGLDFDTWKEYVEKMKVIFEKTKDYERYMSEDLNADSFNNMGQFLYQKDSLGIFSNVPYEMASEPSLFSIGGAMNVRDVFTIDILNKQYQCSYSDINGTFIPTCTIGINANASHDKDAQEFLNYVLSEEAQSIDMYGGLPVNEKALDDAFFHDKDARNGGAGFSDDQGREFNVDYKDVTDEGMKAFKEYILSLTKRDMIDPKVEEMMFVSAIKVVVNVSDIETELSTLKNTLRLYLAE